jgi:nucleoside-diphosphate-sugar epimerase
MINFLAKDIDHILTHTSPLWEELQGQSLFITGGTGFFGCWLLESFTYINDRLNLNARATVLTRNPDSFRAKAPHLANHPAITLHAGDIRSFEFPDGDFPYIIHAATEASAQLNRENPLLMFDTTFEGTRRALEFAQQSNARKFLLTSSGAVYGRQPSEITHVSEEYPGAPDPMNPGSAYGEGKRAAEALCCLYAKQYGIEMKIARCFAFVGPLLPLDTHFAIGNFIRDAMKGNSIAIQGDGTPYRSYLYAADLAIWLWTILLKGKSCYPYNVGSQEDLSIAALARVVAGVFDHQIEVIIAKEAIPDRPIERYVPSTNRALSDLQLTSLISLQDSIIRTVNYLSNARL